jgi:DNA-binding response OmpR family regulator
MRVLIVEDEPALGEFLERALRQATWAADVAVSGAAALEALAVTPYDLVVLDVGLPDMDGFEVCRRYRARGGHAPILVLTARGALGDRVRGLDAGADDYLTKPFAVEELLARLRALARRPPDTRDAIRRYADVELDPALRSARRAGHSLQLTAREFSLLEYLVRTPDRVLTRGQILDHVWNDNFDPVANAVDVLVGRVRRKLDVAGSAPLIHTLRGAGYLFASSAPDDAA